MTDSNNHPILGIIGGSGVYDIEGLTKQRWVKMESPFGAPSDELARAASIWRPLANSPDELAREGLAFYKTLFQP